MTPESLITNVTALVQALLTPLAGLAALIAIACYGGGKMTDSPNTIRWGKQAGLGAVVLFGGTAAVGLLQHLASSVFH